MASDGSKGPKPYKQRQASTVFLRVPSADWGAVTRGNKTEFRGGERGSVTQAANLDPPTPVVAYREHPKLGYAAQLMVLTETWVEPLGAISEESLQREGFPTLAHFRRYWIARTRRRFAPTRKVRVFRVRPWRGEVDREHFANRIFDRLFGAFDEEA